MSVSPECPLLAAHTFFPSVLLDSGLHCVNHACVSPSPCGGVRGVLNQQMNSTCRCLGYVAESRWWWRRQPSKLAARFSCVANVGSDTTGPRLRVCVERRNMSSIARAPALAASSVKLIPRMVSPRRGSCWRRTGDATCILCQVTSELARTLTRRRPKQDYYPCLVR